MTAIRYLMTLSLVLPALSLTQPALAEDPGSPEVTPASETRMALRDLWVEHVFWIRSYVVADLDGDEARRSAAEDEVVANARSIADAVVPFYGKDAGDALFGLLAGHWGAVKAYGAADIAGDDGAKDAALADLTANAREIAVFLSGANPYLPEDAVFGLLAAHGGHHVEQIEALGDGRYAEEARVWHTMRAHMLVISDAITDALIRQFPERF